MLPGGVERMRMSVESEIAVVVGYRIRRRGFGHRSAYFN